MTLAVNRQENCCGLVVIIYWLTSRISRSCSRPVIGARLLVVVDAVCWSCCRVGRTISRACYKRRAPVLVRSTAVTRAKTTSIRRRRSSSHYPYILHYDRRHCTANEYCFLLTSPSLRREPQTVELSLSQFIASSTTAMQCARIIA